MPITYVIGKCVLQERLVFLVELFAGFKVEIFARLVVAGIAAALSVRVVEY